MADETAPKQSSAETTALQCPTDHDLRVPCYCEENAWRLAYRHLNSESASSTANVGWHYFVVFISNRRRCCPMFMQRALPNNPKEYVCWDYHVIVVRSKVISRASSEDDDNSCQLSEVLDVDTWLTPYPCSLDVYLNGTFPHARNSQGDEEYLPLFRVVDAKEYLKNFYSDRMHMFKDGKWNSPPPNYNPIMNGLQIRGQVSSNNNTINSEHEKVSNLEYYINMSEEQLMNATMGDAGYKGSTGATKATNHKTNEHPLSLIEFRSRFTTNDSK